MKTWKMIKELTENPEKKFRVKGAKHLVAITKFETKQIDDFIKPGDHRIVFYNESIGKDTKVFPMIEYEWEEVKEPVSFMEAVESEERIRVEHELIKHKDISDLYSLRSLDMLLYALAQEFDSDGVRDIIVNGKWYVE